MSLKNDTRTTIFENKKSIWNVDDVAEQTGYAVSYIYKLISKGEIPYRKKGKKGGKGAVRFVPAEIIDWVNQWEEEDAL